MFYPSQYRGPDISRVKSILGTLRHGQPVEEEEKPEPYPVAYQTTRKY